MSGSRSSTLGTTITGGCGNAFWRFSTSTYVGFLRGLFEDGTLRMGGPFLDNSGGMAVLKVSSLDEARRIGESDPTVKSGLLTVTPRPWMAAFNRTD